MQQKLRTSVVQNTPCESPSIRIPGPAGEGTVYNGHPDESEDHGGEHATTVYKSTHQDAHRYARELHLVEAVQQLRNEGGSRTGVVQDLPESKAA